MSSVDAGYVSSLGEDEEGVNEIRNAVIPIVAVQLSPPAPFHAGLELLDQSLEFTEEQLWDFIEEHEKRKESNRKKAEDGDKTLKAHSFHFFIPVGLELYCFPQMCDLFQKMISKFVSIPLNKLIFVKRTSSEYNKSLIGLSFIGDAATMVLYADHPLMTEIAELLQLPMTNVQFHGLSTEEIQTFLNL